MRSKLTWVLAAALLTIGLKAAAWSAESMDPAAVGPEIYKKVFENDQVRVFEVTFKPGAKIGMHSHPNHFAYAMTNGALKITGKDGKVTDAVLKPGDVVWMSAQSHSAENPSATEVKLLVTELKGKSAMGKESKGMQGGSKEMKSSGHEMHQHQGMQGETAK